MKEKMNNRQIELGAIVATWSRSGSYCRLYLGRYMVAGYDPSPYSQTLRFEGTGYTRNGIGLGLFDSEDKATEACEQHLLEFIDELKG